MRSLIFRGVNRLVRRLGRLGIIQEPAITGGGNACKMRKGLLKVMETNAAKNESSLMKVKRDYIQAFS